ncbi:MAG: hypothetical protein GVY10_08260 [Verrucomicrobia bacterium]|jgi:hypothetical protein|nr:hypothetical protein [Verrucomicrobiota bacterium]
MPEEFYIRAPEEETARGPYDHDQLSTLAEAGKIHPDYFYFDEKMESWVRIKANEALYARIYPQKKRLVLRQKAEDDDEEEGLATEDDPSVEVEKLLAAAEGKTEETKHIRVAAAWRERTAALVTPVLALILLISAVSVLYPGWNILQPILEEEEGAWLGLFRQPVLFLGLLDAVLAILLFLNATEIFPLIRFRVMIGAGFFGFLYAAQYANGDPRGLWMSLASLLFAGGVMTCTLTLRFRYFLSAAVVGAAGAVGLFFFRNLAPLFMGG